MDDQSNKKKVIAPSRYEIFVRLPTGDLMFLEPVESVEAVARRLRELDSVDPVSFTVFDNEISGFVCLPHSRPSSSDYDS